MTATDQAKLEEAAMWLSRFAKDDFALIQLARETWERIAQ